jgi:hypothetical protein
LKRAVVDERLLERMQLITSGKSFDSRDAASFNLAKGGLA